MSDPTPVEPPARRSAESWVAILVSVLLQSAPLWFLIGLMVITARDLEREVVSRQSVGPMLSEPFPGDVQCEPSARPRHSVIETPHGYFRVKPPGGLRKGAELVLVTKASDKRYLCNVPETICAQVVGQP